MLCKHNDCGWCYAPELSDTNAKQGQCNDYSKCPEYKTLRDGWNIECSMEPVSPLDACANVADDEYDISQHSAEEVIAASHKDTMKAQRELNGRYSHIINTASIASTAKDDPAPAEPEAGDGKGFPPVGEVCICFTTEDNHVPEEQCEIVRYGDEARNVCVQWKSPNKSGLEILFLERGYWKFRPIKSQEQKAERERDYIAGEIDKLSTDVHGDSRLSALVCLDIAEWIIKREAASDE